MDLNAEAGDGPKIVASPRPLLVRCLLRDQRAHVEPVERQLGDAAEFVYDEAWDPETVARERVDLILCVNDYPYDVARCLDAARAEGIPSLVLQDGILEWRCQYANPLFGAGGGAPQHQPVLADKIACIGPSSARHMASWGNGTRIEVTGMPKLDAIAGTSHSAPRRPGRRLLVMTAKKPWYDEAQRAVIDRSLVDLRSFLESRPDIEVVWRVTRGLSEKLGVSNRLKDLETAELSTVLAEVDAVVTTPSTAILEAMLVGRPVAVLDYHNSPRFVQTAWTISSPHHLGEVLPELLDPPESKMLFQRACLSDNLWCEGAAAPRVARLIEEMARRGAECRERGDSLRLPANMLRFPEAFGGGALPPLQSLYPGVPVFSTSDPESLQVRLARLEKDLQSLRRGDLATRVGRGLRRLVSK